MDPHTFESTRRVLHGVAELVLAGPQHARSSTVRLRVTARGFQTIAPPMLRVDMLDLVCAAGTIALSGTFADIANAAGVEARALREVYSGGPDLDPDDPVVLDPEAVEVILDALAAGDAALRAFAPDLEPVLWPEHFDVAITSDEVNYGVSAGDTHHPRPYAYVGPWTPRRGTFWNQPFGAARPMTDLADSASLLDFFHEGARRAAADPLA
jgi:hypothetical protein